MRRAANQWNHFKAENENYQVLQSTSCKKRFYIGLKAGQEGKKEADNTNFLLHQLFPLLSSHPLQFVTPAREDNDKAEEEANGLCFTGTKFSFFVHCKHCLHLM